MSRRDVIQISSNENYLFALCSSGEIYRIDASRCASDFRIKDRVWVKIPGIPLTYDEDG